MLKVPFIFFLLFCAAFAQKLDFNQSFSGKYGQIEVGGPFAGCEFHHSRPLPSRISFYYPVANSLDLSTDYWKRDQSMPLDLSLTVGKEHINLQQISLAYRYTPASVSFYDLADGVELELSWHFSSAHPLLLLQMTVRNRLPEDQHLSLNGSIHPVLRTCQSYAWRKPDTMDPLPLNSGAIASFNTVDTDSARFFCFSPDSTSFHFFAHDSLIGLQCDELLAASKELKIQLILGCVRFREDLRPLMQNWQAGIALYENQLAQYVQENRVGPLPDSSLQETADWSLALLAANQHYLHGQIVPMPCPAEYNFFFTHDLQLTDLGAVFFDSQRVKRDLEYVLSLTRADSIIPHAYYWRDNGYQTEFAGTDNWNHLWFLILVNSYRLHSNDRELLQRLYPLMQKSMEMMKENLGKNNLMYARSPDWWDIGNNYGSRAYLTILFIRAVQAFNATADFLHKPRQNEELVALMRQSLIKNLWDKKSLYFMNGLEGEKNDPHFYAGSLTAAMYEVVDEPYKTQLLQTAQRELLDEKLGVRVAMPADFESLMDLYRFKPAEVGRPYLYLNGAVWPHSIAWYVLGCLAAGQAQTALQSLKKYLTLDGICASPNGQPSFFEYRNSNSQSADYGQVDKPSFLWAGGWYLNCLYQLMGVRENAWNIYFASTLPDWPEWSYDTMINGRQARIHIHGDGSYFSHILVDGKESCSAVFSAPAECIELIRGMPLQPYLARASFPVGKAIYDGQVLQLNFLNNGGEMKFTLACKEKPLEFQSQSGRITFVENKDYMWTYTVQSKETEINLSIKWRED